MSPRLAIVISDLHLGRGNRQDSFGHGGQGVDAAFAKFAADLDGLLQGGAGVDLVLNGDVFDLWEIVTDDQLGQNAYDAINAGLCTPAAPTPADRQRAATVAADQLARALGYHDRVAAALRMLLARPAFRLHYVYGNHDHAMANPLVHDAFRRILNGNGSGPATDSNTWFGYSYVNDTLGLYAEHGDQFAGSESRCDAADPGMAQPAGFYVLRYIWNRVEAGTPGSGAVKHGTAEILKLLVNAATSKAGAQEWQRLMGYLIDYFRAYEAKFIPVMAPPLAFLYAFWLAAGKPQAVTPALEKAVRTGSGSGGDDGIKVSTSHGLAMDPEYREFPGLPGMREYVDNVAPDDLWEGARARYKATIAPFPQLDRNRTMTVVMGHTHRERYQILDRFDPEWRRRYINTGSWTMGHRLLYAWVGDNDQPARARGLKAYVG